MLNYSNFLFNNKFAFGVCVSVVYKNNQSQLAPLVNMSCVKPSYNPYDMYVKYVVLVYVLCCSIRFTRNEHF